MVDRYFRLTVGDVELVAVSDGESGVPIDFAFANVPDDERRQMAEDWGADPDYLVAQYIPLYVESEGFKGLIDTGMGPAVATTGRLLENMQAAGISPLQVDTVMFTHAHIGHTGNNVGEGARASFPNASYRMSRPEWEFWTSEDTLDRLDHRQLFGLGEIEVMMAKSVRHDLLAIGDRFTTFDSNSEPEPGIQSIPAPGHTPGHVAFRIRSGNDNVLVFGDTVMSPMHIERINWHSANDHEPDLARRTRERMFELAAEEAALVFGYHFPFPGFGRIRKAANGWRWEPWQG
jgi:glyoxylase-like metal-dependent hydrolase (beta-lactamase superfamily II)